MSESEDSYTVVEELEEGEIVENAEAEAQACPRNRKRQRSLPRCHDAVNSEYRAGKKRMPKRMEGVELYGQLTGCSPRRPQLKEPKLVTHTKAVAPAHRPNAAHAPQKPTEVRVPCPPQRSRVAPKNTSRPKARTLRSLADPVREEPARNGIDKQACPQLDINSSYDDLLKHHRAIQKELARLEKEQKASRKRCVHKERRKKRPGAVADKNSACPKKDRPSEVREAPSSARQPAAKSPVVKSSAKTSPRIGGRLPTREGPRVPDSKPSVEAVKSQPASRPDVQGGVDIDDEDLEQLRLRALATCFSKLPAVSNGSLDLEKGPPNSFVDRVGVDKENSVPNSSVGSSAFSVSLNFDNYSVLDMEESDSESAMIPCDVDEPDPMPPLPPPPAAIPLPPRNEDDDDLEIIMLRAQVLRSMAKATRVAKEQSEPDSTTPFVVDEGEAVHSDGNSAEEGRAVESALSVSAVAQDSGEAAPSPPPKPSSSTAAVQVPRISNGVAGPGETTRNQPCGAKFKTQQKNAKFGDHPWVFMKQDPLIINLQDDSTEESDSESDSERENKLTTLVLLERLIEAEKNRSNPSRAADASAATRKSPTPGLVEEPAGVVSSPVGSEAAGDSCTQSLPVGPRPVKSSPEKPTPPAVPSPKPEMVPEEKKAPVRSLVNAYQLLQKKLALASSTLKKEQQILTMTKIHASKKMSAFITSQLEVQRLKEQLTAAERVKNTSMRMMFRANVQLKTVQNSVDKRAMLIRDLEQERRKLEAQLSTRVPSPPHV